MKISYLLDKQRFTYEQSEAEHLENLSFLLSNPKGDFLTLGLEKNSSKYQGLFIMNPENLKVFKVLDEITLSGLEVSEVINEGFRITRKYSSKFVMSEGGVDETQTQDSFYLGPTGGLIYEVKNYEGPLTIDLDCRERDDFDEWERHYTCYKKENLLLVKYVKKKSEKEQYCVVLGIKAPNFVFDLLEEFVAKEYPYSKKRNSLHERYIFRLLRADILGAKKIYMATGTKEEEVLEQLFLLEGHEEELKNFDASITKELSKIQHFEKPLTQDILLAHRMSRLGLYQFLNKELKGEHTKEGAYAGLPWFSSMWARDELASLKAYMLAGEEDYVKNRLMQYLESIDEETGMLKRIEQEGALQSADAVFWLGKRFEDFIFTLDTEQRLYKVFTLEELTEIYRKLTLSFNRIIKHSWNRDLQLLNVKQGDSWMDTIPLHFPLDIQVQLTEFVSSLGVFAGILDRQDEAQKFLDFENGLRENIRENYLSEDFLLSNELDKKKVTANVFLCYYMYKDLFVLEDWEQIFDRMLKELKTNWGGLSSLSHVDPEYHEYYTGENNESYHRGDSWYWINNIAAIALFEVNEKKYRKLISDIVLSSTHDILKLGTLGFGSEISSAGKQKAEGCLAQLWSSAMYLEMIEKLYEKK
jgi:hypothetical protein